MYQRLLYLLLTLELLFSLDGTAQEATAPNGKFATIDGLKIYYEESGKGTPVILLHAFFTSASQWKSIIPELSAKYRVIAVDLPGHARSDYMDTSAVYLHRKVAGYIIGLINYLKLDSVYLIGASSGAIITLFLATMRPDLVKRAIVISGFLYRSNSVRKVLLGCDKIPNATEIAQHGKQKALLLHKQFIHFSQLYDDPSFTPDVLSSISGKTLIIHGDNDNFFPIENACVMHDNIPGSYLWVVPNSGHFCFPPFLSAKNESEFVRITMEFLDGEWDKK